MSEFDDFDNYDDIEDLKSEEKASLEQRFRNRFGRSCSSGALIGLLIFCVFSTVAWNGFFRFGVNSDFAEYREFVRSAELDDATRTHLLDRLDHTNEHLLDGNMPSFWVWITDDEEIEQAFGDYEITAADIDIVERILDRLDQR